MTLTPEEIQQRIANLTRERDAFASEANLKLAQWNGYIGAYEQLLAEAKTAEVEAEEEE